MGEFDEGFPDLNIYPKDRKEPFLPKLLEKHETEEVERKIPLN